MTKENEVIKAQDLAMEITEALKDLFVAQISNAESDIMMQFLNGQKFILIDTAGIRKKKAVEENVEYYSVIRALGAIRRADVCIMVVDSKEGLSEQDVKICGYVHEQGKPSVIVMNKWDLIE